MNRSSAPSQVGIAGCFMHSGVVQVGVVGGATAFTLTLRRLVRTAP